MKYKIRVFYINSNEEALIVDDVFDSKNAADTAIEEMESKFPDMYEYVKLPVQ